MTIAIRTALSALVACLALVACKPTEDHRAGSYFPNATGLTLPGQGAGAIAYFDGGTWSALPAGTAGQVLGAGPAWVAASDAGGGNSGWITDLDLDVTAQSTQTFGSDGTYTVAGNANWRKINSAGDATPLVLTNGVGIVVTPASATEMTGTTYNAPWIGVQLASLISGFHGMMPLKFCVHITANNVAANYDNALFGAAVYNSALLYQLTQYAQYGVNTVGTGSSATLTVSGLGTVYSDGNGVSDNVVCAEMPDGAMGPHVNLYSGSYASGWPSDQSLRSWTFAVGGSGSTSNSSANLKDATSVYAFVGAKRSSSATAYAVTYAHLRVQHKP